MRPANFPTLTPNDPPEVIFTSLEEYAKGRIMSSRTMSLSSGSNLAFARTSGLLASFLGLKALNGAQAMVMWNTLRKFKRLLRKKSPSEWPIDKLEMILELTR